MKKAHIKRILALYGINYNDYISNNYEDIYQFDKYKFMYFEISNIHDLNSLLIEINNIEYFLNTFTSIKARSIIDDFYEKFEKYTNNSSIVKIQSIQLLGNLNIDKTNFLPIFKKLRELNLLDIHIAKLTDNVNEYSIILVNKE